MKHWRSTLLASAPVLIVFGLAKAQTAIEPIRLQTAQVPQVQSEEVMSVPLTGFTSQFSIRFQCASPCTVTSVYVKTHDPDGVLDVNYYSCSMLGSFTGLIEHFDFDPAPALSNQDGFELLSNLQVDAPVGVADGATLVFGVNKNAFDGNETIDVGVVYYGLPHAGSITVLNL